MKVLRICFFLATGFTSLSVMGSGAGRNAGAGGLSCAQEELDKQKTPEVLQEDFMKDLYQASLTVESRNNKVYELCKAAKSGDPDALLILSMFFRGEGYCLRHGMKRGSYNLLQGIVRKAMRKDIEAFFNLLGNKCFFHKEKEFTEKLAEKYAGTRSFRVIGRTTYVGFIPGIVRDCFIQLYFMQKASVSYGRCLRSLEREYGNDKVSRNLDYCLGEVKILSETLERQVEIMSGLLSI